RERTMGPVEADQAAAQATVQDAAISARNASKLFLDGTVVAFRQLTLAVRPQEILCIVGPSGCGKTTFLRAIAGLIGLSAGALVVRGKIVAGPPDGVAMVFQHFGLLPWKTVLPMRASGSRSRGHPPPSSANGCGIISTSSASPASRITIPISSPAACSSAWD